MAKSVLLLTEMYGRGGLETHIESEIRCLRALGFNVYLAVGKLPSGARIPEGVSGVQAGLEFGPLATAVDILLTLNQLRSYIRLHGIELVHAHPFTGSIIGFLLATLERLPFVLTIHGPGSVLYDYGNAYKLLLQKLVLPHASLVVCVSEELSAITNAAQHKIVLPNPVRLSCADECVNAESDRVALASRLDQDKLPGVLDFLRKARRAGFKHVDIYGDGDARSAIMQLLSGHSNLPCIELKGWTYNLASQLSQYWAVAGMGRVVLEVAAAQKCAILVGYDGLKGLLNHDRFMFASRANFSGRGMDTIDGETLAGQLAACPPQSLVAEVYNFVANNYAEEHIWLRFANNLSNLRPAQRNIARHVMHLIGLRRTNSGALLQDEVFEAGLSEIDKRDGWGEEPGMNNSGMLVIDPEKQLVSQEQLGSLQGQINALYEENKLFAEIARQAQTTLQTEFERLRGDLDSSREALLSAQSEIERQQGESQSNQDARLAAQGEIERLQGELDGSNREVDTARQLYATACFDRDDALRRFHKIKRSSSWRATAPFREIAKATRLSSRWLRGKGRRMTKLALQSTRMQSHAKGATLSLPESGLPETPLLANELVIISGVPFDDVGGGQRSAQLTRCALKSGRRVVYIHVYKKFDFSKNASVHSNISLPNLVHLHIDDTSPIEMLKHISVNATILIEFPHPKIIPFMQMAKERGIQVVFELIDDWETSLGGDWFDAVAYREFVARADMVVGTAKILVDKLAALGRLDAVYLPNAANEYIFDKYKIYPRPTDFPANKRRTAIYFGSLYGEWFSWDNIDAAARRNPDLNILLIGDLAASDISAKSLPDNVHFMGAKAIDDLPGYLSHSDFAILPFVPGKISDAVSPIKVFEYLFLGKPVVATALDEIKEYPGVFIAETCDEFAELCAKASKIDTDRVLNDRFISENSWFSRLDNILAGSRGDKFPNSVSAIVLMHNNINIIGRCLETLSKHGASYLKEIIVVDNASCDGGAEFVERVFPHVRLLRNPANGCSSGRNLGASISSGKFLAFFDSDQWFTSCSFFEEALTILTRNPTIGAVAWGAGWFDSKNLGGPIADSFPNRAMNEVAIRQGYRTDTAYLGTCGFFLPKSVFDATGGFDTHYDPTCFEDTDLSFQIKALGFHLAYRDLTGIRHQPHQTTGADQGSSSYKSLFQRNSSYFKQKWAKHKEFFVEYIA